MPEAVAYSTQAVTVALAVFRPRFGWGELRVTIGMAALFGVAVLFVFGLLGPSDLLSSAEVQWRPLLTLTCIMVMTGVVREVAAFERLALRLEAHARTTSPVRAFNLIFLASVVTPSFLNNDAAILLLTPVVVALARRLYPSSPRILEAFAFAVFLAPGVAPFLISNPMNMIVAEYAHIGFNAYAAVMAPISAAGALMTYVILRFYYRDALRATPAPAGASRFPPAHPAERPALFFLLAVFLSYPLMAALGGPMWSVALLGAAGCLLIALRHRVATPRKLASHVSVDILAFLWGVFLIVAGLRHVGVIDRLAAFYDAYAGQTAGHYAVIGVMSALGSAVVDNHPMSILNMMALGHESTSGPLLAALIGGDIGPRLLPIGSLAGLLWIDLLRRRGIHIGVAQFVRVGTAILVPTLALSLALLWLLT